MSLTNLLQQQSQALQQVSDLKKTAIQNYGIESGIFSGAKTAYATGRRQIAQLVGDAKNKDLETIIPIAAVGGKAVVKKLGIDAAAKSATQAVGEGLSDAGTAVARGVQSAAQSAVSGIRTGVQSAIESATNVRFNPVQAGREPTADEQEEFGGESLGDDDAISSTLRIAARPGDVVATRVAPAEAEETGAKVATKVASGAAEEGGEAIAAESALPGIGEVAMAFTALGMLIHGIHKDHKEAAEEQAASKAPVAPDAPNLPSVTFDSAPVIDSSTFHAL